MEQRKSKKNNLLQTDVVSKLPTSPKYRRLYSMALLTLGATSIGLFANGTTVHGATQKEDAPVNFTPQFRTNTKLIVESAGKYVNTIAPDNDSNTIKGYTATSNTRVRYTNIGRWNGKNVDMVITVSNPSSSVARYWFGEKQMTVSISNTKTWTNGEYKGADLRVQFVEGGTTTPVNFGSSSVGIAYTDLEPEFFYVNGTKYGSLRQSMTSKSPVAYWKSLKGVTSEIDRGKVANNTFIMRNGVNVPSWAVETPLSQTTQANLGNNYKNSGAVGIHTTSQNDIKMRVEGYAGVLDLFYLSHADVTIDPPVKQPKPQKTIEYNGGSHTDVTLQNAKHPFTYNITTNIKADGSVNGTGFTIKDKLPDGFVVTDVRASGTPGDTVGYFSHTSASQLNSNGGNFEAKATRNVYDRNRTITYRITGYVNKETAFKVNYVNNTAEVIPPKGSDGGGKTNTVTARIPKRDIKVNYWDFDHNERALKNSTVFEDIPVGYGIQRPFTPPSSIYYNPNRHTYNFVKGKDDGTYTTPPTLTEKETENKNEFDFYYRTKWKGYVLHQVNGTNPSYNQSTNPDGALLKKEAKDLHYKTDDGKRRQTWGGYAVNDLTNSKGEVWLPLSAGETKYVEENDTQTIRINYEIWKMYSDFDWIKLDVTPKNDNTPMETRGTLHNSRPYPLVSTSGIDTSTEAGQQLLSQANKLNQTHLNNLKKVDVSLDFYQDLQETSSKNVFNEKRSPFRTGSDATANLGKKEIPLFYENKELKSLKREKADQELKERAVFTTTSPTLTMSSTAKVKADTYIRTSSEKVINNSMIKGDKATYEETVRTLYVGKTKKITPYKEKFEVKFTPKINIKTGYYHTSEMVMDYKSDTDQKKWEFDNFSMNLAKQWLDGDRKSSDKNKEVIYNMDIPNKDAKNKDFNTPNLPDLKKWKDTTYNSDLEYQHVYSDLRNGDLHTETELKKTASSSKRMLDGGKRYYVPVWADVKPFKATYQTKAENGSKVEKDQLGVNLVSVNLEREFNVVAQMYSDYESGTKGKDELYLQPIYTDDDYSELPSGLNAKEREWLTSLNEQSQKN